MNAVLILEDDRWSRSVLNAILERSYRVTLTDSSEDAIRICLNEPPDLLVADNLLRSATSGVQTVCRVHELWPKLPFLIVSGTPPEGWHDDDFQCFGRLVMSARLGYLDKPFTAAELTAKVSDLMNADWNPKGIQLLYERAAMHRPLGRS